jgi:Tfp pilus assembly protein PilN
MIEINLLPGGSGKKKSSRGGGGGGGGAKRINLGAFFSNFAQKIKDPWLLTAIGSVALALVAVGGTYFYQEQRISSLTAREQKGLEDSTTNSVVLKARAKAEAKRDTLLRRMNLIRAIDEDRFIWPHVLDEVSKALPPYTWLSSLAFMGTPQGTVNVAAGAKPEAAGEDKDKPKKKSKKVDTEIPRDEVRIRMIGLTPDIQALTRFMRQLEASAFFTNVQLNNSQFAADQGKDVTQFTLDVTYSRPDTSIIRRVPLAASVK